jgi:hypothetical protein
MLRDGSGGRASRTVSALAGKAPCQWRAAVPRVDADPEGAVVLLPVHPGHRRQVGLVDDVLDQAPEAADALRSGGPRWASMSALRAPMILDDTLAGRDLDAPSLAGGLSRASNVGGGWRGFTRLTAEL